MLPFDVHHKIADLLTVKDLSHFAAVDKLAKLAGEASATIRAKVVVDLAEMKTFDSTSFKRNLRLIDVGDLVARCPCAKRSSGRTCMCIVRYRPSGSLGRASTP